jgi:phospholipase/carboxylesterase
LVEELAGGALMLAMAVVLVLASAAPDVHVNPGSGLRTLEVGRGRAPFVLLHGYGGSAGEWIPFASGIRLSSQERFVFPEGPETTTLFDGHASGRAWWDLNLGSYRRGTGLPDMSASRPPGLDRSSAKVRLMLGDLRQRAGAAPPVPILGGFSQGAMIAAATAFESDEPLRALVLLAGTIVDEARWTKGMPRRKGLPVFIAHGRHDQVLPFALAARLEQRMREAGLEVTWVPFDGGHDVPDRVVTELNSFLERVGARK